MNDENLQQCIAAGKAEVEAPGNLAHLNPAAEPEFDAERFRMISIPSVAELRREREQRAAKEAARKAEFEAKRAEQERRLADAYYHRLCYEEVPQWIRQADKDDSRSFRQRIHLKPDSKRANDLIAILVQQGYRAKLEMVPVGNTAIVGEECVPTAGTHEVTQLVVEWD